MTECTFCGRDFNHVPCEDSNGTFCSANCLIYELLQSKLCNLNNHMDEINISLQRLCQIIDKKLGGKK